MKTSGDLPTSESPIEEAPLGPTPVAAADTAVSEELPDRLERRRLRAFLRNKPAVVALVFLLIVVLSAVFASWLAPFSPTKNELRIKFSTPGTYCGSETCSAAGTRWLGTDDLGRDLLSRLLFATRVSLAAGLGSVLVALAVALPIGAMAGYVGGKLDWLLMRFVDVVLSIPPLILVFAVAGVLGASLRNAIIALGVYFTPLFIRLIRGEVRAVAQGPVVEAERSIGVPAPYLMVRHVLPVIASPLIVQVSLSIGAAILAEASLSFLGLGVQAPTASWGIMLKDAFNHIGAEPWMLFIPSTAVAFTVLALNVLGDGLRDALGKLGQ